MLQGRSRLGLHLGAIVTGIGIASISPPAFSCGACYCDVPLGVRPSGDDAAVVPTNARFLISLISTDGSGNSSTLDKQDIRLVDSLEQEVDFELLETKGQAKEAWVVPSEALAPNSRFKLQVGNLSGDPTWTRNISTSTQTDTVAPEVTGPKLLAATSDGECGPFRVARLAWESLEDNGSPMGYFPVVEARVESGNASSLLFLDAKPFRDTRAVTLAVPTSEDAKRCWGPMALPLASFGAASLRVTLTVYDQAGNGKRLEPLDVEFAEVTSGCASNGLHCAASPQTAVGGRSLAVGGLVGLLSLLFVRWRRRAT